MVMILGIRLSELGDDVLHFDIKGFPVLKMGNWN